MRIVTPSRVHPFSPSLRPGANANQVGLLGLVSSLLLVVAFPPIGFAPVVWLAPISIVLLIRQKEIVEPTSWRGRHPYLVLWCTSMVFWLYAVHWLRLPHWAGYFSWTGLSILMACYTPLFVGLSRVLVHRCRLPIILAAPIVWTGLELLRAHFPDGFPMASLSQAQYRWPLVLQIADLAGGYGLSFVIVLAAACVARMMPWRGQRAALWPVVPLAAVVVATLGYGWLSLLNGQIVARDGEQVAGAGSVADGRRPLQVAMIQNAFDTTFGDNPQKLQTLYDAMRRLSSQALRERPDLDLLIWPETLMLALIRQDEAEALRGSTLIVPAGKPVAMFMPQGYVAAPEATNLAADLNRPGATRAALIIGVEFQQAQFAADQKTIENIDDYNSSLLVSAEGRVLGRYDKQHAVIFGEYMPFGDYLPWLYALSPLRDGLREGQRPESFEVSGVRFSPSICYESILPHEVHRGVARLRAEGREPDVLVNQTNSGWFWGSSELDLHLACNVLRAVECRKPMLVAANTGFSAWIDDTGAIRGRGPRRDEGIVYATVAPARASSVYTHIGDWPAGVCLIVCGLAAAIGLQGRWSARRRAN